jgi:hypothetical protein
MPGLVPGIPFRRALCFLIEMAGTSPAMTKKLD